MSITPTTPDTNTTRSPVPSQGSLPVASTASGGVAAHGRVAGPSLEGRMQKQMFAVGRIFPKQGMNMADVLATALMVARPSANAEHQPHADRPDPIPAIRSHTVVNRIAQLQVDAFRRGDIAMARRLSTVRDALNKLGLFSVTCPQCGIERLTVDLDDPDDKGHCQACERRGI